MAGGQDPHQGREHGDSLGANQSVERGEHSGRLCVEIQGGVRLVFEGLRDGEDQRPMGVLGRRSNGDGGVQKSSFLLQLEKVRYKRPRVGQSGGGRQLGAVEHALLLPTLSLVGEGAAEGASSEGAQDGHHRALVADQAILRDSTGLNLCVWN